MSWIYLVLAGCMEICGVITMKQFALTSKKIYLLAIALLFSCSLFLLSLAMKGIAMGVAYAIWTGIGAGGGVMVGIIFFKENESALKIILITLILLSSIGLKLLS